MDYNIFIYYHDVILHVISYIDNYDLFEWCYTNKLSFNIFNCKELKNRTIKYMKQLYNLKLLATNYNSTNPKSIIDINKFTRVEELIILLWERKINVGEWGFSINIDKKLSGWAITESTTEENEYEYLNEHNRLLIAYNNSNRVKDFLYSSLYLPRIRGLNYFFRIYLPKNQEHAEQNLEAFNKDWILLDKQPLKTYDELQYIFRTNQLSKIKIVYVLYTGIDYQLFLPMIDDVHELYSMLNSKF
jgi:hypothetical protein